MDQFLLKNCGFIRTINLNSLFNMEKKELVVKFNKLLLAGATAAALMASNAHAVLLFQGSTTPTADVPMTPSEARAAWEAELASFDIDTLAGANGSGTFTSALGNTYSETGNGSMISSTGYNVSGNRNNATLIEFNVEFPTWVNAVGFDVYDNDGGGMTLTLTDANTGVETVFDFTSTPGTGRTEFFGVVFDPNTYISALRVGGTDPGGITSWDDFTTGVGINAVTPPPPISNVNAPATFGLLALSMAAFGARSRRNKK